LLCSCSCQPQPVERHIRGYWPIHYGHTINTLISCFEVMTASSVARYSHNRTKHGMRSAQHIEQAFMQEHQMHHYPVRNLSIQPHTGPLQQTHLATNSKGEVLWTYAHNLQCLRGAHRVRLVLLVLRHAGRGLRSGLTSANQMQIEHAMESQAPIRTSTI